MSASYLESHDEETVSLADVLYVRDGNLTEVELWAVCLQCCHYLESHIEPSSKSTLCTITPDTVTLDSAGNLNCIEPDDEG